MKLPTEGSRDVNEGIIISTVPDICLTPQGGAMVPVPYTIWCRQADAANLANSVRQTNDRSHAISSFVLRCYGDEPGTGGGIHSGTTGAECTPKTWSQTVRAEDRNMVRHNDEWWMNHRNTSGRLFYTKDTEHYVTKATDRIVAQIPMLDSPVNSAASVAPQMTQMPQASSVDWNTAELGSQSNNAASFITASLEENVRITKAMYANDNDCGNYSRSEVVVDGWWYTHCGFMCTAGVKKYTFMHQLYGIVPCPGAATPD